MPYLPFKVERIIKGQEDWHQVESREAYDLLSIHFTDMDSIVAALTAGMSVETPMSWYRRKDDD